MSPQSRLLRIVAGHRNNVTGKQTLPPHGSPIPLRGHAKHPKTETCQTLSRHIWLSKSINFIGNYASIPVQEDTVLPILKKSTLSQATADLMGHGARNSWLPVAVMSVALAGCASEPKVVDDTPLVRTATIVTHIENEGIKGQFGSAGNRTIRTVADMRREDDDFKYTGSIMSRIGPSGDQSEITRLDRELIYNLDNKRKTYRECPLDGCGTIFEGLTEGRTYEEDEQVDEDNCQLSAVKNDVSLVRTGAQRYINGFMTDEYLLTWELVLKDDLGEQMQSELTARTWTTPVTGDVAEAVAMAEDFEAARLKALNLDYPESLLKSLPPEALDVIVTHLLQTMGSDEARFLSKLSKLTTVEGFPISHAVEWKASNGTCAAPAEPEQDNERDLDTSSFKGLLSSIGKKIVDQEIDKKREEKLREIGLAPVFSYTDSVQSITIEDIRSSQLDVPANYKLQSRR